ncbi:hypothetical protein CCM_04560 [Cordyceps militaris CM01]|uniref:Myb-like DNA-binding domain-containing protein n=1 Tax=Cordyceps militaris (strain CM01) TaxID=983644 RepID=G3JFV4_CORMM|nr:uncharacterized protein CCM_04560 [Cordyceps militaris CM01]EGX93188.1 hypothetical protein CCM_04560 [Cordyceps militaris CM01]
MSSKIDAKENVRFLVSCIGHSSNGKINFDLVAKECEIVSRGAAAKRYERLLKSFDVVPGGKPTTTTTTTDAPDVDEEPAKPAANKRKARAAPSARKAPAVKKAKVAAPSRSKKTKATVKEEDEAEPDIKAESESSLSDAPEELNGNANAGEEDEV